MFGQPCYGLVGVWPGWLCGCTPWFPAGLLEYVRGERTLGLGRLVSPAWAGGSMAGLTGRGLQLVTQSVNPIGKWALNLNLAPLPSRAVGVGGVGLVL